MPFVPGPRRAAKDENGDKTYLCSWEGESDTFRLYKQKGVNERGKFHTSVDTPQASMTKPTRIRLSTTWCHIYIPSPQA